MSFSVEEEGGLPFFGHLVAIQNPGICGDVVAVNGLTLTTDEPGVFAGGSYEVVLRRPDGSQWGPDLVTQGANANELLLTTTPDFTIVPTLA